MPFNVQAVLDEIEEVLKRYDAVFHKYATQVQGYPHRHIIQAPIDVRSELTTLIRGAIKRLAPTPDYGVFTVERGFQEDLIILQVGILRALRDDYANGRILSLQERIRCDVFSDFLEMAEYLIEDEGLKEPAAVLAGGVLEEHLRKLCDKRGITLSAKPKLDAMNADLARKGVYGKNEQKQITAWAGIRNDAAHARRIADSEPVKLMIAGIRDFLSRCPG